MKKCWYGGGKVSNLLGVHLTSRLWMWTNHFHIQTHTSPYTHTHLHIHCRLLGRPRRMGRAVLRQQSWETTPTTLPSRTCSSKCPPPPPQVGLLDLANGCSLVKRRALQLPTRHSRCEHEWSSVKLVVYGRFGGLKSGGIWVNYGVEAKITCSVSTSWCCGRIRGDGPEWFFNFVDGNFWRGEKRSRGQIITNGVGWVGIGVSGQVETWGIGCRTYYARGIRMSSCL